MSGSASQILKIPGIGNQMQPEIIHPGAVIRQNGVALSVDKVNWQYYPYQPVVQLYAGWDSTFLWLHYEVKNDFFRANALADQEAVWEDSCVEFFFSADLPVPGKGTLAEESTYRNFEFNALGHCYSAVGNKWSRELVTAETLSRIQRFPVLKSQALPVEGESADWELTVAIPLELLGLVPGSSFRSNFYKCGDQTFMPHFLSWRGISSPEPDFHLPQFFGETVLDN